MLAIGTTERPSLTCRKRPHLGTERREVHHAVVDDAGDARVVEDTRSTTQAVIAIARNVIGESHARGNIVQAGIHAVLRHAIVANKKQSRRRVRIHSRSLSAEYSLR